MIRVSHAIVLIAATLAILKTVHIGKHDAKHDKQYARNIRNAYSFHVDLAFNS